MNGKKILIVAVVGILLCIFFWPDRKLRISSVENGNTIVLTNGATVKLLGVSSTVEGKDELESLKGAEVELVPDAGANFDVRRLNSESSVNAYVVLPKYGYECINATLLKQGLAPLVENCVDSLKRFQKYASNGRNERTEPVTPDPGPKIVYEDDDIHLDPYTPSNDRKHDHWYSDGNENLEMLEEACDYNLPYTKKFANELAAKAPGNFNPDQICEIFNYCYKKWRYVNDPADKEYVAKASESIYNSLTGDCDDFAVLMASCILAVGGRPCINTGFNPQGGHAFTEVDISQFDESMVLSSIREHFPDYSIGRLNTRNDGQHIWLNLDWQAAYPGGEYYDCSLSRDSYPYENGAWTWRKLR